MDVYCYLGTKSYSKRDADLPGPKQAREEVGCRVLQPCLHGAGNGVAALPGLTESGLTGPGLTGPGTTELAPGSREHVRGSSLLLVPVPSPDCRWPFLSRPTVRCYRSSGL